MDDLEYENNIHGYLTGAKLLSRPCAGESCVNPEKNGKGEEKKKRARNDWQKGSTSVSAAMMALGRFAQHPWYGRRGVCSSHSPPLLQAAFRLADSPALFSFHLDEEMAWRRPGQDGGSKSDQDGDER
ncbi:hypothetical protein ACOMHN_019045 [Nucella lapillus]